MRKMHLSLIASACLLLALGGCQSSQEGEPSKTVIPESPSAIPAPDQSAPASGSEWGKVTAPDFANGRVHATFQRAHGPLEGDTDFLFATVDAYGNFHLADPATPAQTSASVGYLFADCPSDTVTVDTPDAPAEQVSLAIQSSDGHTMRGLHGATSAAMAAWLDGSPLPPEPGSAHFDWLYVAAAAKVQGYCELAPGYRTDIDITLIPGWNLRRTTFLRFSEPDEHGEVAVTHLRSDIVRSLPVDAAWHLSEYTH